LEDLAEFVVDYASKLGVTYVDVRIEKHYDETIEVMNSVPEKHIVIRERGAGIRILANGAWGFQSTTNLNREGLKKAAEIAFKVSYSCYVIQYIDKFIQSVNCVIWGL